MAAQIVPTASAQPTSGVIRLQLDTSNCVSVIGRWVADDVLFKPIELEGLVLPGGAEVKAVMCR
jgi:hypothetical protein